MFSTLVQQNLLNPREQAVLTWCALFSIYSLFNASIRPSVITLIKSILHIKIVILFVLMSLYIFFEIALLKFVGYWDMSLLKDTVFWVFGTAVILTINYDQTTKGGSSIKKLISDNIKLAFALEFFANLYSFSFIFEFLAVPPLLLVAGMQVLSARDTQYQQVNKIMTFILSMYGLTILIKSILSLIINITTDINMHFLKSFLAYPTLTLFYLPFVYIFALYANYEYLLRRFKKNI